MPVLANCAVAICIYSMIQNADTEKKKMTGSRDFCRSDQSGSNFVSYIDMKIPQPLSKCEQVKYILARIGKDQGHRKCRV
jgi:hypothetical protein